MRNVIIIYSADLEKFVAMMTYVVLVKMMAIAEMTLRFVALANAKKFQMPVLMMVIVSGPDAVC